LLGVLLCAFAWRLDAAIYSAVIIFALGLPHYFSTYTFYFDDTNRAYYRANYTAFYLGPVLVVLALVAALALHLAMVLGALVNLWNVFHVSRQNSGILSLYRHRAGGNNALERGPATVGVLFVSLGLYLTRWQLQPTMRNIVGRIPFGSWIPPLILAIGIVAIAVVFWRWRQRPKPIALAEAALLMSSVVMFLPFVILRDAAAAAASMLSGHFIQYLGLLWLLNHRKYAHAAGSPPQRALSFFSRSGKHVLIGLAIIVALSVAVDRVIHFAGAWALHSLALNAIVLLHFYIDGLVWAFKRPFVRQTVGPYLTMSAPPSPTALAAA
jgi:hypothetical protein